MKKTLIASMLLASTFAISSPNDCSPYVTETLPSIANARNCDEAAKIATDCNRGSKSDGFLASAAIKTCETLMGGERALTAAQNKRLKASYKSCAKTFAANSQGALFCMLEAIRQLSLELTK